MSSLSNILKSIKALFRLPITLSEINTKLDELHLIKSKLNDIEEQLNNIDVNFKTDQQVKSEMLILISGFESKIDIHFLQIESLFSIYNSLPNLRLLPSTRGWAGSPDFLAKILEVILKEKPGFVLEASSGVSTVIIGLALKLNNYGKSISLEHDSLFTKISLENIKVNAIEDFSSVKYCPLTEHHNSEQVWKWYETADLDLNEKIDILIIDGPPRYTQHLARLPAVPLLYKLFSDRILILLDDTNRHDEIVTLKEWIIFLENNGFKVSVNEYKNFEKGMAILEACRLNRD